MAWKSISKEGLAFLGSVLLQIFSIIQNPQTEWWVKLLAAVLYIILIPVLMYKPEKRSRGLENESR